MIRSVVPVTEDASNLGTGISWLARAIFDCSDVLLYRLPSFMFLGSLVMINHQANGLEYRMTEIVIVMI